MKDAAHDRGSLVVVGGGAAGTGAAIAAAEAGLRVTLVEASAGASALATGALDEVPWETAGAHRSPIGPELGGVLDALADFAVVRDTPASVLTAAGVTRAARGRDAALLDVSQAPPGAIAVARCRRPGWDADALARSWGERFLAVEVPVLRRADEDRIPDADFAALHDDDERLAWLAARVRDALRSDRWSALVLPPSLGVERARAADLSTRTGVFCGEASGLPGGPSGLRFEHARDRALAGRRVERHLARVTRLVPREPGGYRVEAEDGAVYEADAVVLATGGLLGGGLTYAPSEVELATALPPGARVALRATIDAPIMLGTHGRPLESPGSLFGVAPERVALPAGRSLLDSTGFLVDDLGAVVALEGATPRRAARLYAAGDAVADAARTWLAALASGARAGFAAARALHSAQ